MLPKMEPGRRPSDTSRWRIRDVNVSLVCGDNSLLRAGEIESAAVRSSPALPHDLSPAIPFARDGDPNLAKG